MGDEIGEVFPGGPNKIWLRAAYYLDGGDKGPQAPYASSVPVRYPDMSERQNVTLGRRSGVTIVSLG